MMNCTGRAVRQARHRTVEDTLALIHVEYTDTNGENKLRKHANGALRLPLSGLHAAARSARNATGKALPA